MMFEYAGAPRLRRREDSFNAASLCRVCLSSVGHKETMSTATKLLISQIFHGQVALQENWKICAICLSFVNKAAEFRVMVKESDRRVKEMQNAGTHSSAGRSKSMYATTAEVNGDEVDAVMRTIERERRMAAAIVLSSDEDEDDDDDGRRSVSTMSMTCKAPQPAVDISKDPIRKRLFAAPATNKAMSLPPPSPPRHRRTAAALKYFPPPPERRAAVMALQRLSFKPEPKKPPTKVKKVNIPKEVTTTAITVKNWKCCAVTFMTVQELHAHKYIHHPRLQNFSCQICLQQIKTRSKLILHLKETHMKEKYTKVCNICSKKYHSVSGVRYHSKVAHPELFD